MLSKEDLGFELKKKTKKKKMNKENQKKKILQPTSVYWCQRSFAGEELFPHWRLNTSVLTPGNASPAQRQAILFSNLIDWEGKRQEKKQNIFRDDNNICTNFSDTLIRKKHYLGNLKNKEFIWAMISEFIMVDKYSSKRQAWRKDQEAECSHLETQVKRLGEKLEVALYIWSQSPPLMPYFLQNHPDLPKQYHRVSKCQRQ